MPSVVGSEMCIRDRYGQLGMLPEIRNLRGVRHHSQTDVGITDGARLLDSTLDGTTSEVHRCTLGLTSTLEVKGQQQESRVSESEHLAAQIVLYESPELLDRGL